MKYVKKFVLNSEIDDFLEEFETDGEYEDYEILCASLGTSSVLFILKLKEEANS